MRNNVAFQLAFQNAFSHFYRLIGQTSRVVVVEFSLIWDQRKLFYLTIQRVAEWGPESGKFDSAFGANDDRWKLF